MPKYLPIPGDSDDARAVSTRSRLGDALIELMHERGFNDISVQEICQRAGVGRSTFYAHFQDREELFIRHTVVFGRTLGAKLRWDARRASYSFPVAELLAHVRKMKPLFDSLARARKTEFILRVWHNNIAEVFEEQINAARVGHAGTGIPAVILAQQLSGTLMTLLTWSMDHHYPLTGDEMERHYQSLIAGIGP